MVKIIRLFVRMCSRISWFMFRFFLRFVNSRFSPVTIFFWHHFNLSSTTIFFSFLSIITPIIGYRILPRIELCWINDPSNKVIQRWNEVNVKEGGHYLDVYVLRVENNEEWVQMGNKFQIAQFLKKNFFCNILRFLPHKKKVSRCFKKLWFKSSYSFNN